MFGNNNELIFYSKQVRKGYLGTWVPVRLCTLQINCVVFMCQNTFHSYYTQEYEWVWANCWRCLTKCDATFLMDWYTSGKGKGGGGAEG